MKELFKLRHASLRNVVERAFGVTKKRFRFLQTIPEYVISVQSDLILCCFVLHNFIVYHQLQEDDDLIGAPDAVDSNIGDIIPDPNIEVEAELFRTSILYTSKVMIHFLKKFLWKLGC
jgi:hypothetical protein